ncbi:MAG: TonB-dependent receptor [Terriglobales bacterium]|jgi:hypothetical protein
MSLRSSSVLSQLLIVMVGVAVMTGSQLARAQTFRGGIHGTVDDSSGAFLARAEVKAANEGTGQVYRTVTTSAGEFTFQDLPLGSYTVSVRQNGFQPLEVSQVTVRAGSIYSLPLKLALASVATKVEVAAAALSVDTTTSVQTEDLATSTVQTIPLNGRDFTQLLTVTPGYAGYGVGFLSAINGAQATQTNWQIEGADNNDAWINTSAVNQGGVYGIPGVLLPVDSVDEFSLVTQGNAETGRNPGGTVNLVLKSGTNRVHGSAYYYNRNEALAASPVFAANGSDTPQKNKLRDQQYGFTVGGPIFKDRTFFFLSFERQSFDIGIPTLVTEPSQAYQQAALAVLTQYNVPVNPVSENLLAGLWPASALTGLAQPDNYFNPGTEDGYSNNGILKLDHAFNESNRVSLRAFVAQGHQIAPTSSFLSPYFESSPMHVENWALVYNSTLSPRLANQFVFGFNYFGQTLADANTDFNPIALGLNTGVTSPQLAGAPNITIGAFDPIGLNPYSGRQDTTWHLTDALSYNIGKHQLRFGGEFRRSKVDEFYHTGQRGTFSFDGYQGPWAGDPNITDGNITALADFLAGFVYQSTIVTGNPSRTVFTNGFSFFGQDNFQITHRLNINLGLRYDYIGPIHDGDNDLSTFIPSAPGGLVVVGEGIKSLYPSDWTNFGPRVGFAYQPFNDAGTVVRGGFGIAYDTVNVSPFLGNSFIYNGGPAGVEGNPIGNNSSQTLTLNGFTLPTDGSLIAWPTNTNFNLFSVSQNFKTPYLYNYSLNVQKSLGRAAIAQVGYVGSLGRHLLLLRDINQAALGSDSIYPPGTPNQTRPYYSQFQSFSVIDQLESRGNSNYNSLQATLKTSSWHGVTSQFAYTFAHTLDYGSFTALPQNSFDPAAEYGNSDFDARHNFTAYLLYALPQSSHGLRLVTNGWKVSSLLSFRSGLPFTVDAYGDPSGTGENTDRPSLTGNPYQGISHSVIDHQPVQWINPNSFTINSNQFGTMGRNQLFGPGFSDVDFSVLKDTPITERVSTQFRIEIFNLFNRINLGSPTFTGANGIYSNVPYGGTGNGGIPIGSTNGSQFGLPGIGPGEPFNVQLALKLLF